MKIKAQDGNVYEVHNLEMSHCKIKCEDAKDRRKKHVLGEYADLKRTCDVFGEIAAQKTGYFEMPEFRRSKC